MSSVEITGRYGDPEGEVRINDENGDELVMWTSDEWIEDPSLVFVIASALKVYAEEGPEGIRQRIPAPTGAPTQGGRTA